MDTEYSNNGTDALKDKMHPAALHRVLGIESSL